MKKYLLIPIILIIIVLTVIFNKSITVSNFNNSYILGGEQVGVKLLATGVLIIDIDDSNSKLKIGDIILKVNNKKIETNRELKQYSSLGEELTLEILRDNKTINIKISPKLNSVTKEYNLGLWVKDSSAGVGTITFHDSKTGKFAALGHGITETNKNYIVPISTGAITSTTIYGIEKGISDLPGEIKGTVTNEILGEILGNSSRGIYGKISDFDYFKSKQSIEILPKKLVKEGTAYIYCKLDNSEIKRYEIKIEKVLNNSNNKNMIIKVIDKELLDKTGGIIQGMSGSPIVQNNKLVGAVTHVFLNDPTKGYGVFIENMIEDMNSIE